MRGWISQLIPAACKPAIPGALLRNPPSLQAQHWVLLALLSPINKADADAACCSNRQGSFVGQQVLQHASQLDATWPIRNGMIYEWQEMRAVWSHAFTQVLVVQPRQSTP